MKDFRDLEVWKQASEFRKEISALAKTFPSEEKYKLTDQILRSSRSVCNNVAEGHGRYHYQENTQFCRQARGSLTESLDHLIIALDEGYINQQVFDKLEEKYRHVLKLLNGYIAYLQKRKAEEKPN